MTLAISSAIYLATTYLTFQPPKIFDENAVNILCGRFSIQDLANIASGILNKTLRFLQQVETNNLFSIFLLKNSHFLLPLIMWKYPESASPVLKNCQFLWWFIYIYIDYWEMTRDYYWLIVSPSLSPTSEDDGEMGGGPNHSQTRPDQLHNSQFLLWPLTTNTERRRRRTIVFARSPQPTSINTEVGGDIRSWCSKNSDIRTRRCARNHKETCQLTIPIFLFTNYTAGNFLKVLKYNSFQVVPGEGLRGWHNVQTLTKYKFFRNFSLENFNLFTF